MAARMRHESHLAGYHKTIGGSAGEGDGTEPGTHGGVDIERPTWNGEEMPRKSDCDYVVSTAQELIDRIQENHVSIYLDETKDIFLINSDTVDQIKDIWMGEGVELVGAFCDPEIPGRGPVIVKDEYDKHLFKSAYGEPPTLWGVPFIGPMLGPGYLEQSGYPDPEDVYFDPRSPERTNNGALEPEAWYANAVFVYDKAENGTFRAIGCEFAGWSFAGLATGAKNYRTDAEIVRCSFHNNLMETLGYGITVLNGKAWLHRCYIDRCRHGVAGFGSPHNSWEISESVIGKGPFAGHGLDMHDWGSNVDTDRPNLGGHHIAVRNITCMLTEDIDGTKQEGIAQRGVSLAGEAFHSDDSSDNDEFEEQGDEIWNSHFFQKNKPKPTGERGDAYREGRYGPDHWESLNAHDNIFGAEQDEETLAQYGAPRAEDATNGSASEDSTDTSDPITEAPSGNGDGQTLTIEGVGQPVDYTITVSGDATAGKGAENSDVARSIGKNKMEITGTVVGFADQFDLAKDASIDSVLLSGPAIVRSNGKVPRGMDGYISAGMQAELRKYESDMNERLTQMETRLSALAENNQNPPDLDTEMIQEVVRSELHRALAVLVERTAPKKNEGGK